MNRSREKLGEVSVGKDKPPQTPMTPLSSKRRPFPEEPASLTAKLASFLNMASKQEIGIGSYAQVYKVFDRRDNTYKALRQISKKQMTQSDLQQQRDINERLMKLVHPNILKIYQILEDASEIYYLLEYCEGGSLWDALNYIKGRKFSEKEATLIVLEIAKAIQVLHQNGITHRDLKPENILLSKDFPSDGTIPAIKLTDFGLSTNKTLMETIAGTKQYIAPEQIKKERYTKAVDIWALGIIFDQLIHGVPYFTGEKHQEVFNMIVTKEYRVRSDKIKSLTKSMLYQMLKKNPHDRPKISEVVEKLTDIVETFEFYEKKKGQSSSSGIGLRDADRSPEKPIAYDAETVKQQYQVQEQEAIKESKCPLHPNEVKLHRRNKSVQTCQKCLQEDKSIIPVEEYLRRLKLKNRQQKQQLSQGLTLPDFHTHELVALMRNDKLAKQFGIRRQENTVTFNKLKHRYGFLNLSVLPVDKKQNLDRCRQQLKQYSHDTVRTLHSCTEVLMATIEARLQRHLDSYLKQAQ